MKIIKVILNEFEHKCEENSTTPTHKTYSAHFLLEDGSLQRVDTDRNFIMWQISKQMK